MPRKLRQFSKSNVYHIIIKGIDNQNMFYDDKDRIYFLNRLLKVKKEYKWNVYAYCLMDNHVHLVIKVEKVFLSRSMQSLTISYVHYFNRKYERKGAFFIDRFFSKSVETQEYFLRVCRYVHRNPENANMSKTQEYRWSSYKEYIEKRKIINREVLLYYFNEDLNQFIEYTKINDETYISELADYEIIRKLLDDELADIIRRMFSFLSVNEVYYFFNNKTKEEMKTYIEKLKNIKGTNRTQIARVIRVNRKIISDIWN